MFMLKERFDKNETQGGGIMACSGMGLCWCNLKILKWLKTLIPFVNGTIKN